MALYLIVSTPPTENEFAVRLATSRKVAVFCEKPLTDTLETAEQLTVLTEGMVTGIDFLFAELETFRGLKQLIEENELGFVNHVHVWLVESWAQSRRQWIWKTDTKRGGRDHNLLGAHVLYLASG